MPKFLAVFIHRETGERVELNTQIAVDRFFENRNPSDWRKG